MIIMVTDKEVYVTYQLILLCFVSVGSVQSMTLNFKDADSSSDDDSTADVSTGKKPVIDESEETRL